MIDRASRSIGIGYSDQESPLLALSLAGGPTRQPVKCAKPTAFAVASQSLYYVECGSDPNPAVHVMDPAKAVSIAAEGRRRRGARANHLSTLSSIQMLPVCSMIVRIRRPDDTPI